MTIEAAFHGRLNHVRYSSYGKGSTKIKFNFIFAKTYSHNGLLSIVTCFISCGSTLVHFASILLNKTTFVPP